MVGEVMLSSDVGVRLADETRDGNGDLPMAKRFLPLCLESSHGFALLVTMVFSIRSAEDDI